MFRPELPRKTSPSEQDSFLLSFLEIAFLFTAKSAVSESEIKNLLISQIEGKVRWLESVEFMINEGVKNFIEIGPGKVLCGLIRRINKNANFKSINSEDDIKGLGS